MKVQISLDDKLTERADNYAENNYMSRSGLISLALTQYLNQVDMITLVKDMSLAMRKIADTAQVDNDTMEKLRDLERFCKMLTGQ